MIPAQVLTFTPTFRLGISFAEMNREPFQWFLDDWNVNRTSEGLQARHVIGVRHRHYHRNGQVTEVHVRYTSVCRHVA